MKEHKNSIVVDIGEIEDTCFVIMPFDSLFKIQYERVIRPAIEDLGFKCVRGDEIYSKPNIMADIWRCLRSTRLVVAELTGRNANVFYEVGLAHAIGKPIILLTRDENDVPFDLKALRYCYYDINDPFWGKNLRNSIKQMIEKVLEEQGNSTYLEGISLDLKLPDRPKKININQAQAATAIDISGNWNASWEDEYDPEVRRQIFAGQYQGFVSIIQQGEELSGIMTTLTEAQEGAGVVQENLVGQIKGTQVSLNSVSYTFVQRGNIANYYLDNFNLRVNLDDDTMTGEHYDSMGKGPATFTKQKEDGKQLRSDKLVHRSQAKKAANKSARSSRIGR
jgi:hypothetical protein